MIPFEYRRAGTVEDAVAAVADRPEAVFLAGGTNLVDHMKLGVAAPSLLVDIGHLPLSEITELPDGGLRIGAGVRNTDLAVHPLVRSRFPALSRALLSGASGQLRNLATTGGNLLQRTRCVYFQDVTTPCNKREPGSGCAAIGGYVRYHAILGASEHCVAVHPSDMAVAMSALDAKVVVTGGNGESRIPLTEFHRLPGDRPELDTVLTHGQLITAVELPAPPTGARSTYRKVRDRASYAFALVSVAAELTRTDNGEIASARVAFGGIAHKPWRAREAEAVLQGSPATEETFEAAAESELAQAKPLEGNEFKVELARRALVATLRSLTEPTTAEQVR
ncbi:xanthine dehydrogenase family protein subunit M [Nocardia sp. XZ_19_369]|uniref:FAD binding domain-containing protein n=1 Tax=Nocardia sp. XZ_19_369 TaxID=2769487 RepID=UPI00188FB9FD|nr:xanthine dehydrogenase family protein subunit M [Nocardia sp. XZ_19_369]